MKDTRGLNTQTLLITVLFNAALLAAALLLNQVVVVVVIGAVLTLGLWFVVERVGNQLPAPKPAAIKEAPTPPALEAKPAIAAEPSEASAIQLLSILQRKGRLIDFLQEDLHSFDDAQIGAAVRTVHEGCKKALDEYISLEPIMAEAEGSRVTIAPGFDAHAIRLVGNVVGDPPFKGALQHRGWRVARVDLPERVQAQEKIVAPAEVEV